LVLRSSERLSYLQLSTTKAERAAPAVIKANPGSSVEVAMTDHEEATASAMLGREPREVSCRGLRPDQLTRERPEIVVTNT
jgi:hypothetical protein